MNCCESGITVKMNCIDEKCLPANSFNLLQLPREILDKIFGYFSYEHISKLRLVCKDFEEISSSMLNSAFQRLQTLLLQKFHAIKTQMPRRESARRKHAMAREYDVIETLHMRLTLLQMAFGKHIERKHCCFFAGEILDEVHRILRYLKTTPNLARAYKVTDELFDLSTMAMEYFKEQIEPTLPEIKYFNADFLSSLPSSRSSHTWKLLESVDASAGPTKAFDVGIPNEEIGDSSENDSKLEKRLIHFHQLIKKQEKQNARMWREVKKCRSRLSAQEHQTTQLTNRLNECNKKSEESLSKFNAVFQELNKCKAELQFWRSKSPANQTCVLCNDRLMSTEDLPTESPLVKFLDRRGNLRPLNAISRPSSSSTSGGTRANFIPILTASVSKNEDEPSAKRIKLATDFTLD